MAAPHPMPTMPTPVPARRRADRRALLWAATAIACLTSAAAAQAQGPSGPVADTYQVRPGDTLTTIIQQQLDASITWVDVARLNDIADPRRLKPGTVLKFRPEWLKSEVAEGQITSVGGNAQVDGRRVAAGETVTEGTLVETGSDGIAVIRLADGTQLRIPPASRVRIDRLRNRV